MNRLVLTLALLLTLAAACGQDPPAGPPPLAATAWVLHELRGRPPLAGATITLDLAAADLGGTAGCNHYGGPYTAQGGRFTVGQTFTTEMYCAAPPGVMEQEQDYLAALAAVTGYRLAAGRLELLDAAGQVVLAFSPAPPVPVVALEGTDWVLTTWLEGDTAASVLAGTAITLRLEEGHASGTAGCNQYGGPYTLQGGTLRLGPLASTRMYCADPPGVMDQEGRYLELLSAVTAFEVSGRQLILRTATGAGLVFDAR